MGHPVFPNTNQFQVNYLNISYEYENERGYGPGIVWQVLRILGEHLNLSYVVETVEMNSDLRWDDAFKILKNTVSFECLLNR